MGSPGPWQFPPFPEEVRARPFDRIIFQFPQHKERNKARRGEAGVPVSGIFSYFLMDEYVSHEKNPPTFHYTGWLIGILTMVYYNPYIAG